ncbi:efflux RND transporter periplasmic adaptor subunit [Candidatus Sumerlaeota bacterium]|nr:efflux RND transporter periplasmic adaptor subunit [Candidatus Sumerlaeota bacterium]
MTRGRPKSAELTGRRREEILDAATRVFAREGYPNTDLQVIADKLKLGKGTLYRYFPSKQELFLAAADRGMILMKDYIKERADRESDPLRRVAVAVVSYLEFFSKNPEFIELIIQERAEFRDRKRPTYIVHREANIGPWKDFFRELIGEGKIRDIPVDRITDVMSAALYGSTFINYFAGGKKPARRQAEDLCLCLLAGAVISACDLNRSPAQVSAAAAGEPTPSKDTRQADAATDSPSFPPPASVPAAGEPKGTWITVGRETLYQVIGTLGTFQAKQTSKLGAQVQGRVEVVLVDVGDTVKKGQELVRLEAKFFELELAQRRAELETARVSVSDAKVALDRNKALWGNGKTPTISQAEMDRAQTVYDLAVAKSKQVEETVRYAEERLKETVIRAPYDGVISQRLLDPGEPITGMMVAHMLEIQQIDPIELVFSVAQENISRLKKGTRVLFRVEGVENGQGAGLIDTIYPAADEATRTIRCRVTVENHDLRFRPSLLAEVGVVQHEVPNALALPRACLNETASGMTVAVLENGQTAQREVKTGITFLDKVEITDGLKEGDKVLLPEKKS